MNYDIVFMDLDGTLLRDDKSMPEENSQALRELIDMGVEVVISSGRSHMSLKNVDYYLKIDRIVGNDIAFNGSTVTERYPFKIVYEDFIDNNLATIILKHIPRKNGIETYVYSNELLWVTEITDRVISYSKHSFILPKRTRNIYDALEYDVNKIIVLGDNEELIKIKKKFDKTDISKQINCCFSSNQMLEFNPIDHDKGTAAKYIMGLTKHKGKKSLAIGDNFNDIPLFEACDFSVAVANSPDDVKKCASAVTEATNNDGVLNEIIEKYIK